MKREMLLGTLLLVAITVGVNSPALAGTGKRSNRDKPCDCGQQEPGPGGRGFLKRMAKDLKLTDAQQEQIKAIFKAERDKSAPLMEKMAEARKQLHTAAGEEKFDEAAIRALAAKKAEIEIEMTVARAKVRNSIIAVLTPEQRAKAEKMGPPDEPPRGRRPVPPSKGERPPEDF